MIDEAQLDERCSMRRSSGFNGLLAAMIDEAKWVHIDTSVSSSFNGLLAAMIDEAALSAWSVAFKLSRFNGLLAAMIDEAD